MAWEALEVENLRKPTEEGRESRGEVEKGLRVRELDECCRKPGSQDPKLLRGRKEEEDDREERGCRSSLEKAKGRGSMGEGVDAEGVVDEHTCSSPCEDRTRFVHSHGKC